MAKGVQTCTCHVLGERLKKKMDKCCKEVENEWGRASVASPITKERMERKKGKNIKGIREGERNDELNTTRKIDSFLLYITHIFNSCVSFSISSYFHKTN